MFSSTLTIMRKGHPGWEGVIFFKDLNSHYSLFCDWQGRKRTRTLCLHPVSFLHWRCLCVSSPLQNFCYFLNIQNHRWQRTAIKDNPLSLAFHFVVCNSVRRGFFFFFFTFSALVTVCDERLNTSRAQTHITHPMPSPRMQGLCWNGTPQVGGGRGWRWGEGQEVHGESVTKPKVSSPVSTGAVASLCCSLIGAGSKYNLVFPVNRIREMQI